MKKYKIDIIETVLYSIEIEAKDEQEADDKATDLINGDDGSWSTDGERLDIRTEVEEIPQKSHEKI